MKDTCMVFTLAAEQVGLRLLAWRKKHPVELMEGTNTLPYHVQGLGTPVVAEEVVVLAGDIG